MEAFNCMHDDLRKQYKQLLSLYLVNQSEELLFEAQQLSKRCIEQNIGLSEVVAHHFYVMEDIAELPPVWKDSYRFFLEFLIYYGLSMKERQELLFTQQQYEVELSLAASVQQSHLPNIEELVWPADVEVGVLSVPARKVSGDFYNFSTTEEVVELAVADISGKSIPASIYMSMMRFAMDEIIQEGKAPHILLEMMNRYVYRHTESATFVTMFCGNYQAATSTFSYANAGHEPALWYQAGQDRFVLLTTDGCALGITKSFRYETRSVQLQPGDFLLLYTDGVIESRDSDRVDDSNVLQQLLREIDLSLPAQDVVNRLHQLIVSKNNLVIPDDQTLVMLRKTG